MSTDPPFDKKENHPRLRHTRLRGNRIAQDLVHMQGGKVELKSVQPALEPMPEQNIKQKLSEKKNAAITEQ